MLVNTAVCFIDIYRFTMFSGGSGAKPWTKRSAERGNRESNCISMVNIGFLDRYDIMHQFVLRMGTRDMAGTVHVLEKKNITRFPYAVNATDFRAGRLDDALFMFFGKTL